MDDWQELLNVWRTASHVLDRKIQAARQDIYETQQEMGRYGRGEIYSLLEDHYWIMVAYLEEIKQQGYEHLRFLVTTSIPIPINTATMRTKQTTCIMPPVPTDVYR